MRIPSYPWTLQEAVGASDPCLVGSTGHLHESFQNSKNEQGWEPFQYIEEVTPAASSEDSMQGVQPRKQPTAILPGEELGTQSSRARQLH